jgi:hypothetical protein
MMEGEAEDLDEEDAVYEEEEEERDERDDNEVEASAAGAAGAGAAGAVRGRGRGEGPSLASMWGQPMAGTSGTGAGAGASSEGSDGRGFDGQGSSSGSLARQVSTPIRGGKAMAMERGPRSLREESNSAVGSLTSLVWGLAMLKAKVRCLLDQRGKRGREGACVCERERACVRVQKEWKWSRVCVEGCSVECGSMEPCIVFHTLSPPLPPLAERCTPASCHLMLSLFF